MTALLPETIDTDVPDDLRHSVCVHCYPPDGPFPPVVIAVCGAELPTDEWEWPDDAPPPADGDMCVVCVDLMQYPCARCGAVP